MRIAYYPSSFLPNVGGAEIVVHNLALQQHLAGHRVVVIASWTSWRAMASRVPYRVWPLLPRLTNWVLRARRCGHDLRWMVELQLACYQQMARFDVWHVHTAYHAGFLAAPFLRRRRLPSVITCHGADIQKLPDIGYGFRLDPILEKDIAETLSMADRVTALSDGIRSEFRQVGVCADRILRIPNGVDVRRIACHTVDLAVVRKRLGWPLDKTILLTVGRNHPKKGYSLIPDIIQMMTATRSDFLWVIVGRNAESIAERARSLGVADCLQVLPQIASFGGSAARRDLLFPTEELVDVYKAADLFVFPSRIESFGVVLVEAMAAGLPLVTTDAPGCCDVVRDGINGLISPVDDAAGMARNILRLMSDSSLRAECARKAMEMSTAYEWSRVAAMYYAVYEELVAARHACGVSTEPV